MLDCSGHHRARMHVGEDVSAVETGAAPGRVAVRLELSSTGW